MSAPAPQTRIGAVLAMVNAMAAATVDTGVSWSEERWAAFVRLVDEAGRFVFGFPAHFSSESDIFGALDDIAADLAETQIAVNQSTAQATRAVRELRKALEPLLPDEDEEPRGESAAEYSAPITEADVRQANPSPALDVPAAVEALSRVGRASESAVAVPSAVAKAAVECEGCHKPFKAGLGIATHRRSCPKLHPGEIVLITPAVLEKASKVQPQTPSEEDERYFEAIRRLGNDASYADVARDTRANPSRIHQRLDLLASYYTLPADVAVWRAHRTTKKGGVGIPGPKIQGYRDREAAAVSQVAADIKAREAERTEAAEAKVDGFSERRRQAAAEVADRAWQQRNADETANA